MTDDTMVDVLFDDVVVATLSRDEALDQLREVRDVGGDLDRWDLVYVSNGRLASWVL